MARSFAKISQPLVFLAPWLELVVRGPDGLQSSKEQGGTLQKIWRPESR